MSDQMFYSLEQVAKMLQVSERTIMREIKAGKIEAFKVGKALRFKPEAVQAYVERQKIKPGEDMEDGQNAA